MGTMFVFGFIFGIFAVICGLIIGIGVMRGLGVLGRKNE